jgi:hypothetical protein
LYAKKIISGGQTGVDRGALDACLTYKYPAGGWCPKGRIAEDGKIDIKYPLNETEKVNYEQRTWKNVKDSGGTLIISPGILFGGTFLTLQFAKKLSKPCKIISTFHDSFHSAPLEIFEWIKNNNIDTLNIAGPRQSEWLTGYEISFLITEKLIQNIKS